MERSRAQADPVVIAIVGPTATGKTAAAVHIARSIGGEIISADSAAVYRGLDIGTAKPGAEERSAVRFHLVNVADPSESFNVAQFVGRAEAALSQILSRAKRPLVVGGTGLYVRALLEGYGLTTTPPNPGLRSDLNALANELGTPELHARLLQVDPAAAARIHRNDRVRLVRALEVIAATGRPISEQHAEDREQRKRHHAVRFGFTAAREELRRRIDARVDRMVAAGLEEEVRGLLASGCAPTTNALRSLGYKEMVCYLEGGISKGEAIQAIKENTLRFAKRQLTWFRAEESITWIDVGGIGPEEAAESVLALLRR